MKQTLPLIFFLVVVCLQYAALGKLKSDAAIERAAHKAAEQILVEQVNTLKNSLEVCIQTKVQE